MIAGFGLFEKKKDRATLLRQQAEDVYARLRSVHPQAGLSGTPLRGQHEQRRGGPGHAFWQYRDFQSGDHSRLIDWKQSAKSDRILIRQKERETQRRTSIWVQGGAGMAFGGKSDNAGIVALVIAMLSRARHDPFTLAGAGTVTLAEMTDILIANDLPSNEADLSGHELFLIGDFLDENIWDFLEQIPSHKRTHLIHILSTEELYLPYQGRAVFDHPGDKGSEHVFNIDAIRAAYQEKLRKFLEELQTYCQAHHWSYTFIRSGDDLLPSLLGLLMNEETAS